MRRRYVYGVVWVVATAVAAGGSWLGVRSMLDAGGPQRSVSLNAKDLRDAVPTPMPPPTPTPTPSPKPKPTRTPDPTPTDEWRRVGNRDGVPTFERTFRVVGGTVTFRCNEKEVNDIRVTPRRDHEDSVQRLSDIELRVSFTAEKHVSRVFVAWEGDECRAEISESA